MDMVGSCCVNTFDTCPFALALVVPLPVYCLSAAS